MQQDHRLAVARTDIHVANIQVAGADLLDLVERPASSAAQTAADHRVDNPSATALV